MLVILQTRRNQGVKTVNKTIFKRSWVFLIVIILALTLVACGKSKSKVPYGSLSDKVYSSADGFTVTEKELYEQMRLSGSSGTNILLKMFHEILYKEEMAKVKADKETYKEDFLHYVNKSIFNNTDRDALKELPAEVIDKNVQSYIDAMDLLGAFIDDPLTAANIDIVNFEDHTSKIFDYYTLDVAKRVYAREKLDADVEDEDSTSYINVEKDIAAYFKNNVEKRYPLSYVSVRFSNQFESDTTLRKHAIKPHVGQWYVIPDPRVDVVTGYALSVLENLDLEDKNGTGDLTSQEFQSYYNDYKIDPLRPAAEGPDVALTMDQTLNKLLTIHNEVYPYKDQFDVDTYTTIESVLQDSSLVGLGEEKGSFTFEYDDFPVRSTNSIAQIRTYLYSTLSVEGTRFTAQPRAFGGYYYILFKLQDHDEDVKDQIGDDDLFKVYESDGKTLTSYAQTYFDKIKESKLTDNYVNQKVTDRLKEAKVVFFDDELHTVIRNEDFKLSKKASTELVAQINDTDIKVDDFYARLERQLGVSVAMDTSVGKALLASDYRNQITDKQMSEYRTNIENMIRQFSQDTFKDSGFPKEMGRAKFLKVAFGANSIDDAVEKLYVKPELEKIYLKDYEAHFGAEIYDKFATYANRIREQYFSLSNSHFLIYIDMNEDESPDKPEEFFETLTEEKRTEYKAQITALMQLVHDKASAYSNINEGLKTIADDFAKSAKVKPDTCDSVDGANDPSCTWADFKKLGLQVKHESLGATTNQTNYPDQQSRLDDNFYNRVIEMYDIIKADYYDLDKKFPSNKLDVRPSTYDSLLETSFGWHLINATGGAVSLSAKFTQADDTKYKDDDEYMIYEHIILKDKDGNELPAVNAYSDSDAITSNQIKIYLYQRQTVEGTITLPNNVKSALDNYLQPVVAKYDNNQTQLYILHKFLASQNFEFKTTENTARFDTLLRINENQFLLYAQSNEMFMEIYGDWFTTFK